MMLNRIVKYFIICLVLLTGSFYLLKNQPRVRREIRNIYRTIKSNLLKNNDDKDILQISYHNNWKTIIKRENNRVVYSNTNVLKNIKVKDLIEGFCYTEISLRRESVASNFKLIVIIVDPNYFYFKVCVNNDDYSMKYFLENFPHTENAILAINGSYFDSSGPIGLVLHEGKIIKNRSNKLAGYFLFKNNRPFILIDKHTNISGATEGIQGNPSLTRNGKIFNYVGKGKNLNNISRRTLIANTVDNKIMILVTDTILQGLTLYEAAFISVALGGKNIINLDGGKSTQLFLNLPNFKKKVSGFDKIPVAIAVYRRTH